MLLIFRDCHKICTPGAPLTYFYDERVRVIFLGLKFWQNVSFFGSIKDAEIFWGLRKKQRDFLRLRKKD